MAGSIESGTSGAWLIHVTCVECGFEVDARECFAEHGSRPGWCAFVDPPQARRSGAFLLTLLRILLPFRTWRDLKLSTPVIGRDLLLWSFSSLVMCWMILAAWCALLSTMSARFQYLAYRPLEFFLELTSTRPLMRPAFGPWQQGELLEQPITGLIWTLGSYGFLLPLWGCFNFVLLILPVTRRRCKVHLSHLLRVAMLSLLPLLVFPLLLPLAETSMFVYTSTWTDGSVLLVFAGGFIYYACWWWLMLRSYLKLPHALAITISMAVMGLLVNILAFPLLRMLVGAG